MSSGQVGNDESIQNPISFQPSSPRRLRRRAAPSSTAAGEGAADEAGWSRSRGLHSSVSQSLPERAPRSRSRRCGGPALAMVVLKLEVTNHTTHLFLQQEIHCTHRLSGWPAAAAGVAAGDSLGYRFELVLPDPAGMGVGVSVLPQRLNQTTYAISLLTTHSQTRPAERDERRTTGGATTPAPPTTFPVIHEAAADVQMRIGGIPSSEAASKAARAASMAPR
uniref:Uncharacterized protein n=1 Tax=Oryza meridionalis TaxID=40149 RepID=A0A0E0CBH9_9ORYZ